MIKMGIIRREIHNWQVVDCGGLVKVIYMDSTEGYEE